MLADEIRWVTAHTMSTRTGHMVVWHAYRGGTRIATRIVWEPPDPPPVPVRLAA
jgi:hypothetical protein